MAVKKSGRSRKLTGAKRSTRSKKPAASATRFGAAALVAGGIFVVAMAMLFAGRDRPNPSHVASTAEREPATDIVLSKTAAVEGAVASTRAPEAAASAPATKTAPVTITGCLERADQTFRLTDTSGAAVPKSRSWKTGFLRKGSASIEVVDAANHLELRDHVGRRVSVTGTLVNREMHVRSLRRVAASCSPEPKA